MRVGQPPAPVRPASSTLRLRTSTNDPKIRSSASPSSCADRETEQLTGRSEPRHSVQRTDPPTPPSRLTIWHAWFATCRRSARAKRRSQLPLQSSAGSTDSPAAIAVAWDKPYNIGAVVRAAQGLAGQAPPDLRRGTAWADDRCGVRPIPDAIRGGRVDRCEDLGAVRTDVADVRIEDRDEAEIEFGWQVDRHGNRRPTKTDGSARRCRSPRARSVLGWHKLASAYCASTTSYSRPAPGDPCNSATSHGRSGAAQDCATDQWDSRPSRCFIRSTPTGDPSGSRAERCPRCTPSGTPSLRGRCSPARASMRWRLCSAIGTAP